MGTRKKTKKIFYIPKGTSCLSTSFTSKQFFDAELRDLGFCC
jgi:hypothetical protein